MGRSRRKKVSLYLLNDDVNSVEMVISVLTGCLPMVNSLQAEQMAMLTHYHGDCQIYTDRSDKVYIIYNALKQFGLKVEVRDAYKNN